MPGFVNPTRVYSAPLPDAPNVALDTVWKGSLFLFMGESEARLGGGHGHGLGYVRNSLACHPPRLHTSVCFG